MRVLRRKTFLSAFMGVGTLEKKISKILQKFWKKKFRYFFRAKIGRHKFLTMIKLPRMKRRNVLGQWKNCNFTNYNGKFVILRGLVDPVIEHEPTVKWFCFQITSNDKVSHFKIAYTCDTLHRSIQFQTWNLHKNAWNFIKLHRPT